jgi:hypothetical protein
MERDSKERWVPRERSIFGPKSFDFHTRLDPHLLGRTVVIDLSPDNGIDRALDAENKARHLSGVREWLAREAKKAKEKWTPEKVRARWDSPEFRARVACMGGEVGRDHVIAATLLFVSDVFGWNFEDAIQVIIRGRRRFEEQGEESEVAEMILALTPRGSDGAVEVVEPDFEIRTDALLTAINDERKGMGQIAMSRHRLRDVLLDLGFRSGSENWRKSTAGENRNRWVIRPGGLISKLKEAAEVRQSGSEVQRTDGALESYGENDANAPHAPHAPQGSGSA